MKLEYALETIENERLKFRTTLEKKHTIFTGIETLDNLLCGFKPGKRYTFIARQDNGMFALVKTITNNINMLYQSNDWVVSDKKHSLKDFFERNHIYSLEFNKNPLFIILDTNELQDSDLNQFKSDILNFENDKAVIIFIHILENTLAKPITLDEIPNTIQAYVGTIISLFRPERYKIELWDDGTTTKQQLECTVLQDKNTELKSVKLFIDNNKSRVQSCYGHSPFLQKLTARINAYLDD